MIRRFLSDLRPRPLEIVLNTILYLIYLHDQLRFMKRESRLSAYVISITNYGHCYTSNLYFIYLPIDYIPTIYAFYLLKA